MNDIQKSISLLEDFMFPSEELPAHLQAIIDTGHMSCVRCGQPSIPKDPKRCPTAVCEACVYEDAQRAKAQRKAHKREIREKKEKERAEVRKAEKRKVKEANKAERDKQKLIDAARHKTAVEERKRKRDAHNADLRRKTAEKKAARAADWELIQSVDYWWYRSNPPRLCKVCEETKRLYDFPKNTGSGRHCGHVCKTCKSRRSARKLKKPARVPMTREEQLRRKAEYKRIYRARPGYRIDRNISEVVRRYLRRMKKGKPPGGWTQLVGYTLKELLSHLESQFADGMTWSNYGEWHIDHIRPKASFDFTGDADEQFLECWALSNLQPLWAEDNIKKGAMYEP